MFTKLLHDFVDPVYEACMPDNQCGGMKKKGTDLANHVVRSVFDFGRLMNLSMAVLFVDLSKAFDYIVREIALG